MRSKFLCFHGFLGSPSDFDFLKSDYDIVAPNLGSYVKLDLKDLVFALKEHGYFDDIDGIVGYSFGARLALAVVIGEEVDLPVFCLAGHMGLETKLEKESRIPFENNVIKKLKELSPEEFLQFWNSLGIFNSDSVLKTGNFENADLYFKNYSLSKQKYLIKCLKGKEKIAFLYGTLDEKYCDYAKNCLGQFSVDYIPNAGHRIIKSHSEVKQWLKDKI